MAASTTEQRHASSAGLDTRPQADIASVLLQSQIAATQSVMAAIGPIVDGASRMARTLNAGGTLHYVAAGSSGLMAASDALELGGTFSIPPQNLRIHMAGGLPTGVQMPGEAEDTANGLDQALADLTARDVVIAVSASGSTPYTLAAAQIARDKETPVIGIANNPGAPLLKVADTPILLETPPEVLSGSTRLGAGTAQKIALNMLSTLMAVELGHVHDGMMVNVLADNTKLRARAKGIVQQITGASAQDAETALTAAGGQVKLAVLIASKGVTPKQAQDLLTQAKGRLRDALSAAPEHKSNRQPGDHI